MAVAPGVWMRRAVSVWVVAVVAVIAACGTPTVRHRVRPGDTLYRIGKAYGVDYRELAKANGIDNADRIEVGQRLVVPNATRELPVEVITPSRAREDAPAVGDLPADRSPFIWPVDGAVVSTFGPRGETHHDGIDIAAPVRTPVRAARGGRVLYNDELRGYGNLVILDHGEGYATVYAHNHVNLVRTGAAVKQGDVIAEVGESGESSEPNLHFEVRQDNVARNPVFYLPVRRSAIRGASR